MSTEIETPPQDNSLSDDSMLASDDSMLASMDYAAADIPEEDDLGIESKDTNTIIGEWSLCASMIFLAGYLVFVMFWVLGHPVWKTLISFDKEVYRTEFPVGVATIILLISVLSAFCSCISLVADKNNRKTQLIRLVTLGPLLPTGTAGFMIWIIIQRGAGSSILENFLG